MDPVAVLQALMLNDPLRRRALAAVAALDLPDGWIGAGFVRDAVWDHLHGHGVTPPHADRDDRIERALRGAMPDLLWSVKNQARMHRRNGDAPYASVADAMRHWPETATAVAVRIGPGGGVEVSAPHGLDDLFALRLRPGPSFRTDRLPIFLDRVSARQWLTRYPRLTLETEAPGPIDR